MDFNSKDYQSVKLKNFFKTNGSFFWFHSTKLDLNQWIQTEQKLKKLKLNYSKGLNGITLKLFKSSIYANISPIVCSFVLFINPNFKTTELRLDSIKKELKPSFELISVKVNYKIYSTSQLKGVNDFSYKKNIFNLYRSLDQHLKTSYQLTKKKDSSK
uniref:Orf157 n=1 Tax=Pseudo-nitzschia multiseries TaxID=37319 RepID=A0A0G3F1H9_PSEMU|nr:orf157 [Pseudo-nitzschia multiseries]AKJ77345.1 orf157 [Pseudo-nitzschia multiseries]